MHGFPGVLPSDERCSHLSQWTNSTDCNETVQCIRSAKVIIVAADLTAQSTLPLLFFDSIDENDMNPVIVLPSDHVNQTLSEYVLERSDWNFNISQSELTYLIRYAPQKAQCFWRKIEGIEGMEEIAQLTTYPNIEKAYVKPRQKCQSVQTKLGSTAYTSDTSPVTTSRASLVIANALLCSYLAILLY